MGCMRLLRALGVRLGIDLNPALAHANFVRRNGVFFIASLSLAFDAMKLPLMPRAHDILGVERALTKGTASVIADAADGAKDPIAKAESDARTAYHDLLYCYL